MTPPICNCAEITYSPIPVRLRSLVTALVCERIFKVLDKISVPGEEKPRKVDLFTGLKIESTENTKRTLGLRSMCKNAKSKQNESILMNGQSPVITYRHRGSWSD